jgi:hypothetical protein
MVKEWKVNLENSYYCTRRGKLSGILFFGACLTTTNPKWTDLSSSQRLYLISKVNYRVFQLRIK